MTCLLLFFLPSAALITSSTYSPLPVSLPNYISCSTHVHTHSVPLLLRAPPGLHSRKRSANSSMMRSIFWASPGRWKLYRNALCERGKQGEREARREGGRKAGREGGREERREKVARRGEHSKKRSLKTGKPTNAEEQYCLPHLSASTIDFPRKSCILMKCRSTSTLKSFLHVGERNTGTI